MRSLLLALRRRMVVKIFMAVALVVAGALVAFAWRQTTDAITQLKAATRVSAEQLAKLIVGNIETTMLQGDGILVKEHVRRIKQSVSDADIHIYDPHGREVFAEPPPPPPSAALPAPLRATLSDGATRTEAGRDWRPIANEPRCRECHPEDAPLRGVLAVAPRLAAIPEPDREAVIAELVREGFVRIMTAKREGDLDDYFAELSRGTGPRITGVAVYDRGGVVVFGAPVASANAQAIAAHAAPGAAATSQPVAGGSLRLVPLPMEDRCEQCHEPDGPVRGVLAIAFAPAAEATTRAGELAAVIDTSLRFIMLSNLGRMITAFLDAVIATRVVGSIELYDAAGRVFYTSEPPPPAAHVADALASRQRAASFVGAGHGERVRVVHPLVNEAACARCHGAGSPVRGVVTVSLSTRAAAAARETARDRAFVFIAVALAIVLVVLYTLLRILVVTPVQRIGVIAEAVGQGRLDVAVRDAQPHGDEVQRLGGRINEMIRGLRAGFHLRRFVSRGAADAAHGAAERSTDQLAAASGDRRPTTVLFTDIRGFTSFSETVPPEQVVDMLNRFLQVQADVVERHGGDIDKYVGDEVMAVFHGPDAAARAVRAGLEMVEAVDQVRVPGEQLHVGCGISTGEVIYGPIGSANRMDFTVIGDVVNTGARLCSAAGGGEVIVSAAVRDACGALDGIELVPLPPLALKGKREPFAVFRAGRPPRSA